MPDAMVVVWAVRALADIQALRRSGRGHLADEAEALGARLQANPLGHRREGTQVTTRPGQHGWARTLHVGPDMCVVGWTVVGNQLVILRVRH